MGQTEILGIVNITEDSFSDGGRYLKSDAAMEHALQLYRDGAHILDLGAASSNPAAAPVPPEVEQARLAPLIAALKEKGIPLSVDTFHPETQRFALECGVEFLNDIQGFPYRKLYPDLSRADTRLIVMHSVQRLGKATTKETDPGTILKRIFDFFDLRIAELTGAGIARERLILDPGMGFFLGSNPEGSIIALRNICTLKMRYQLPLLISVSRKSFLGSITGRGVSERGAATLAAELFAVREGADFIRTHDPAALRDALAVWKALEKPQ